ncbi:hypothetical protein CC85DRAFT_284010 [Cutaneotrichosporon oleaginosum]|uniref:Uncharacterized protein n=1 Tax=Cutaneotrichosporon oleaginosum TaxID=879819 RepID=A0A0J0XSC4_9TREE|nr:uncharacterized protein CC85DRAFT_284010 [Cutaneotrichosporon oleaginosum]KLT43965.1 hypothetical protein CC85DRAFT_284010 [Cutaneotrichosporon oleaginosum]TXT04088.1 hypothetical protein COLE_07785 [Cutaneotrichosporon oleaginosum]
MPAPSPPSGPPFAPPRSGKAPHPLTPAQLLEMMADAKLKVAKEPKAGTNRQRALIEKLFNEWIEDDCEGAITIDGKTIRNVHDVQTLKPSWLSEAQMRSFLEAYVQGATGRSRGADRVAQRTLLDKAKQLSGMWKRLTGNAISGDDREKMFDFCAHLTKSHSLPAATTESAQLDTEGVIALQDYWWSPANSLPLQYRLSLSLFCALACQTGARPRSAVTPSGTLPTRAQRSANSHLQPNSANDRSTFSEDQYTGAVCGDFTVVIIADEDATKPNMVAGYYTTSNTSSGEGKGVPLPLPQPKKLLASAMVLLLLKLIHEGSISSAFLQAILEPAFLEGNSSRTLAWTTELAEKPIFCLLNGNPMTTLWMTEHIKKASIHLGFQVPATANSFRSLVIQKLVESNVSDELIHYLVSTQHRSKSTRWYIGKAFVGSAVSAFGNTDINSSHYLSRVRPLNAIPTDAPNSLSDNELSEVMASGPVSAAKQHLEDTRQRVKDGDESRAQLERAAGALKRKIATEKEQAVSRKRAAWFADSTRSEGSRSVRRDKTRELNNPYEAMRKALTVNLLQDRNSLRDVCKMLAHKNGD